MMEAVLALRQPAIMQMQAREEPVTATPAQLRTAESIMPRVSGLACRIHDSPTLLSKNPRLDGAKRSLDCWVATRWNSDFLCLNAHVYFQKEVETMTGISDNNLTQYWLSADQWKIVTDLLPVLELTSISHFAKSVKFISSQLRVTNKYMKKPTAAKSTAGKLDDICTYLKELVIQSSTVIDSGGYMKWWNTTATSHPNLARMGMNYCSAPGSYISHTQSYLLASSVDAERAFSVGR
ncbi:hypothetical protein D9756_011616 [Leucocoprinus leucothites]|uniref:HAT C-terminal dimerisation domain-containing protein n=1 Tax=Leucocoprinus leucothites TaxID=201217 RepID=A0A8H5CR46_9AGAR|nr:hypothetical protein D9756_011616 [Leucoagaricus leucothites]